MQYFSSLLPTLSYIVSFLRRDQFLDNLEKKIAKMRLLALRCLCVFYASVCPYITKQRPTNGLSLSVMLGSFTKLCRHILLFFKIKEKVTDVLHADVNAVWSLS
jgi:hypothetical protein